MKVGKSTFEMYKSNYNRIPLVRTLDRYRQKICQDDLKVIGKPVIFLTSSSGRAQDIEGHLHTYMKVNYSELQDTSTS